MCALQVKLLKGVKDDRAVNGVQGIIVELEERLNQIKPALMMAQLLISLIWMK